MPLDPAIIVAGAFFAAFAVGAAGFGDALIATAFWLHILSPQEAVPLIVGAGLTIHIIVLITLRQHLDFRHFWPFLLGGAVGTPIGAWILTYAEPGPFRLSMGVFLVAYGLLFLLLRHVPKVTVGGKRLDGGVGGVGGVLGGLAGLSGFVPALWCGQRGWSPAQQRGVTQPYVLAMHGMALSWLALGGLVTAQVGWNYLWTLPGIVLGCWVGVRLYGRLDPARFRRMVLVLLVISGVLLVVGTGGDGS